MQKRYAILREKQIAGGKFSDGLQLFADSGLQAIVKYFKVVGMVYNEEVVAFEVDILTWGEYSTMLLNDSVPENDYIEFDGANEYHYVKLYNSVCTVIQSEFPF